MKKAEFNKELSAMSDVQIVHKIAELKGRLFALLLNKSTSHVKNCADFKKIRKDIARGMTALKQK